MPTNRKQEPEAKKSDSEIVRRQSIASSSHVDQDMPKVMEEIKSMIKDLKKDMSSKLRSIDDKFSNIITELREDIGEVKNDLAQASTDIQSIQRQMDEVDKSIEFHAEKVEGVERQQQEQYEEINRKLNDKIDTLNKKLMMVEKHERKYNLIFHGIQEERSEKLYDKMRAFFVSHMEIDQERAEKIIFSNGHRMPTHRDQDFIEVCPPEKLLHVILLLPTCWKMCKNLKLAMVLAIYSHLHHYQNK